MLSLEVTDPANAFPLVAALLKHPLATHPDGRVVSPVTAEGSKE